MRLWVSCNRVRSKPRRDPPPRDLSTENNRIATVIRTLGHVNRGLGIYDRERNKLSTTRVADSERRVRARVIDNVLKRLKPEAHTLG